jgi:hypothetical protein
MTVGAHRGAWDVKARSFGKSLKINLDDDDDDGSLAPSQRPELDSDFAFEALRKGREEIRIWTSDGIWRSASGDGRNLSTGIRITR